jgi:hypothetical protein
VLVPQRCARGRRDQARAAPEGTDAVPLDVGAQPRLLDRFGEQVHLAAEHLPDAPLEPGEREQADPRRRIQLGRQVRVAARRVIAARHRPEQRQPPDARGAQFRLMRPQRGKHLLRGGAEGRRMAHVRILARPRPPCRPAPSAPP